MLNLPWSLYGTALAVVSIPRNIHVHKKRGAIVFTVGSLWWAKVLPGYKNVRAVTIGQVILLGKALDPHDLQHELIHVDQAVRTPLLQPILYAFETTRFGYKNNKYEKEAYNRQEDL